LAVNPEYDNVHFNLGLLYYRMGRTQDAVQLWRQTLQINPEYTDAKQALETITKNKQ
jgi:tetratricopeptide (TPR) repeat protein